MSKQIKTHFTKVVSRVKRFFTKITQTIYIPLLYKPIYEKFFAKLFMRFKILTYFKSKKKTFCETFLAIKNTYVFYI